MVLTDVVLIFAMQMSTNWISKTIVKKAIITYVNYCTHLKEEHSLYDIASNSSWEYTRLDTVLWDINIRPSVKRGCATKSDDSSQFSE